MLPKETAQSCQLSEKLWTPTSVNMNIYYVWLMYLWYNANDDLMNASGQKAQDLVDEI